MICPSCGATQKDGKDVCEDCGGALTAKAINHKNRRVLLLLVIVILTLIGVSIIYFIIHHENEYQRTAGVYETESYSPIAGQTVNKCIELTEDKCCYFYFLIPGEPSYPTMGGIYTIKEDIITVVWLNSEELPSDEITIKGKDSLIYQNAEYKRR